MFINLIYNIMKARMREGVTQEDLAERIGVTSHYISDLEQGLAGTSISTLMKISRELNVTADYESSICARYNNYSDSSTISM